MNETVKRRKKRGNRSYIIAFICICIACIAAVGGLIAHRYIISKTDTPENDPVSADIDTKKMGMIQKKRPFSLLKSNGRI